MENAGGWPALFRRELLCALRAGRKVQAESAGGMGGAYGTRVLRFAQDDGTNKNIQNKQL
jgi:hypothetical protein